MGFIDFFRPKWKHSDPEVRRNAVDKLTDQNILAGIAKDDLDWDIRKIAIEKLTDSGLQKILFEHLEDQHAILEASKLTDIDAVIALKNKGSIRALIKTLEYKNDLDKERESEIRMAAALLLSDIFENQELNAEIEYLDKINILPSLHAVENEIINLLIKFKKYQPIINKIGCTNCSINLKRSISEKIWLLRDETLVNKYFVKDNEINSIENWLILTWLKDEDYDVRKYTELFLIFKVLPFYTVEQLNNINCNNNKIRELAKEATKKIIEKEEAKKIMDENSNTSQSKEKEEVDVIHYHKINGNHRDSLTLINELKTNTDAKGYRAYKIIEELGEIGDNNAIDAILGLLGDSYFSKQAENVLVKINNERVIEKLNSVLYNRATDAALRLPLRNLGTTDATLRVLSKIDPEKVSLYLTKKIIEDIDIIDSCQNKEQVCRAASRLKDMYKGDMYKGVQLDSKNKLLILSHRKKMMGLDYRENEKRHSDSSRKYIDGCIQHSDDIVYHDNAVTFDFL